MYNARLHPAQALFRDNRQLRGEGYTLYVTGRCPQGQMGPSKVEHQSNSLTISAKGDLPVCQQLPKEKTYWGQPTSRPSPSSPIPVSPGHTGIRSYA